MDALSYKCPACGAGLSFSIQSQAWDCRYCHTSFTLEQLKGKRPEPSGGASDAARQKFTGEVTAYSCPSCGGEILTDRNTAATFCLYCRNPTIIPARVTDRFKPDYILPFKLPKDKTLELLKKVCKHKPFLPKAFRAALERGETGGLYVPFWLFSCEADGYFDGEGDRVTSWSDRNYRYTKTDTYRVLREAGMEMRHIPVDASLKMDDGMMTAIEPFAYSDMVDFSTEYLSGHYAESYDFDAAAALPTADRRIDDYGRELMRGLVTGYTHVRTHSLTIQKRDMTHCYAFLPVWTFVCKYKERLYTFAVNGQTGKLTGRLPVSVGRVLGWVSGIAAGGILLTDLLFTVLRVFA